MARWNVVDMDDSVDGGEELCVAPKSMTGDGAGARPGRAGMDPKGKPKKTKAELMKIWQKLDSDNSGSVSVEEVLRQAKLLEAECPQFIANFEQVAKGGRVTRQAFLDSCLGTKSAAAKKSEGGPGADIDLNALQSLFDAVAGPDGEIRLADLVQHKAKIKAECPALLDKFSEIDLNGSSTVSWEELKVWAGGTEEWLEHRFSRIIGLEMLKGQIRDFHRSVVLDKQRCDAGHDVKSGGKFHMIFQGNPGTGKTTMARVVAELLHRIGIVDSDLLVEVQRDKLVAEYVGQTGPKTQKIIEEAKSGVLFIDEAYRLSQNGGKSDFGREAIEQLMGAMNEPPGKAPVMVFAGYPDDMDLFMKANSGLYRRVAYTFDFTDYSSLELAHILDEVCLSAGFRLSDELLADNRAALARQIESQTLPEARAQMNGGLCERMFDFAKQALDRREAGRPTGDDPPSVILTAADVAEACARIPPPPARGAADDVGGGSAPTPAGDPGADVSAARARRAEARAEDAETEVRRLQAEVRRLQASGSTDKGSTDKPGGDSTVAAPEKYEAFACLSYSCGCAGFFLVAFIVWAWGWFRCIAAWCWKKACAFVRWAAGSSPKEAECGGSVVRVHPAPERPPDSVTPTSPV